MIQGPYVAIVPSTVNTAGNRLQPGIAYSTVQRWRAVMSCSQSLQSSFQSDQFPLFGNFFFSHHEPPLCCFSKAYKSMELMYPEDVNYLSRGEGGRVDYIARVAREINKGVG